MGRDCMNHEQTNLMSHSFVSGLQALTGACCRRFVLAIQGIRMLNASPRPSVEFTALMARRPPRLSDKMEVGTVRN